MKGKWGLAQGWASQAANLAEVQSSPICANRADRLEISHYSFFAPLKLFQSSGRLLCPINPCSLIRNLLSSIPCMASCTKSQKSPHNCCSGIITSQAAPVTRPYKQTLHTNWWILENRIINCHIQLDTEHKAADPFPLFITSRPELRF